MTMSSTFQYVSDIHLEFRSREVVVPRRAPRLILAGDVGDPRTAMYKNFLAQVSRTFDDVFLVAGNHEFYGSTMETTREAIALTCSELPNVHFLDNATFSSDALPVHIFGGTMWSDVADSERRDVERFINDYRMIRGFSSEVAREGHRAFVRSLERALEDNTDKPFLVISHHLPLTRLIDPMYASSPINSAFATDVALATHPRVRAWVYGHTHAPRVDGSFYCNPVGYPGERERVDLTLTFDVGFHTQSSPSSGLG